MATELSQPMKPIKETLELVRFSIDLETGKMIVEGKSERHTSTDQVMETTPIRLLFRGGPKFTAAKNNLFPPESVTMGRIIHMLLRKLEIDRELDSGTLCEALPDGVPPYKEEIIAK